MSAKYPHFRKNLIILHCFDYITNKKESDKDEALTELEEFAKFFHVSLKKSKNIIPLSNSFRTFILNREGYNYTIPLLFNSLR